MYFKLICWILCMDLAFQEWGYRHWYKLPMPKWVRLRLRIWVWIYPLQRLKELRMLRQIHKYDKIIAERERLKEEKDG